MKSAKQKNTHILLKILVIVLILVIACLGGWLLWSRNTKVTSVNNSKTKPELTVVKDVTKPLPVIHMAAMGDMLAHDTIIANAKTGDTYNFAKYFANIRLSYQAANVIFCNQEGLSAGEQYGISGYPSFNAPQRFSADLQSGAGCNLINLANNHMGDKGVAATNTTIDVWNNLKPLGFSGANKSVDDQNKVSFSTVNGIKIGFVSFADFNNNQNTPAYSVNIYHDEDLVRRLVTDARKNADVVIVSMHWGVEDSSVVSADQTNEVNLLASLGVDVIIGTGPHVLQKFDTVTRPDSGKMIVWYSLGNMLSSQLNLNELIGGIAQFDITKSTDNKITINSITFTPTYMHYEWTAAELASNDLLARKNAMIYLLKDAADPLSKSLFDTTVAEQKQYVINTLGSEVTVK
jgi:poly-gamma-glutamate synthesis protein (capsule biosynthesis protein)